MAIIPLEGSSRRTKMSLDLECIIKPYLWLDDWAEVFVRVDEEWETDDLIELGVVINNILQEREDG